jgi:hypothetical protein
VEAPALPDEAADEEEGAEVIDLMALVRRRLGERSRGPRRARKRGRAGLEEAPKRELLEQARELGIAGRSRMSRGQLLASLRRVR